MKRSTVLSVVCFSVLTIAGTALARRITVPIDQPTIQRAIDEALEGDTVFITKGTYREQITMQDGITIVGQDRETTIIKGNRRSPVVRGANNATIENISIEDGGVGVLCENTNTLIQRCIIRDHKRGGIECLIALPDIRNNLIYRNRWTGIYCHSVKGLKTVIEHNIIAENGYCGIMLDGQTEVTVQNNIIFNNRQYGLFASPGSKRSRVIYNNLYINRRNQNSEVLSIDNTNIPDAPGFMKTPLKEYIYALPDNSPCRGKGKGGSDIGPMTDMALKALSIDTDNDGITDDLDKCIDIPEDKDGFEDLDGCPDYDNDNDGIYDQNDSCPDQAEDADSFEDDDGCPDPDNDRDGILDAKDACSMQPETVNRYKDEDGCPDVVPPVKVTK